MSTMTLTAQVRSDLSKRSIHRIRKAGNIPGIVYGAKTESIPVIVPGRELRQILNAGKGLVQLHVEGIGDRSVVIQDVQRNVFDHSPIHVDFLAVEMDQPVEVEVPVFLIGLEEAEKRGGLIQQQTREVVVKCLPGDIPEHITLDISSLEIGHSMFVADLTMPPNVECKSDPEEVVVSSVAPRLQDAAEGTESETAHDGEPGRHEENTGALSE